MRFYENMAQSSQCFHHVLKSALLHWIYRSTFHRHCVVVQGLSSRMLAKSDWSAVDSGWLFAGWNQPQGPHGFIARSLVETGTVFGGPESDRLWMGERSVWRLELNLCQTLSRTQSARIKKKRSTKTVSGTATQPENMKFWVGSRKRPTWDGFSKLKMGFSLCRSSPQPSFSWLPSFFWGSCRSCKGGASFQRWAAQSIDRTLQNYFQTWMSKNQKKW